MTRFLFLFVLLVLAACHPDARLPEGVLPPDKMTPVLKRLIVADEYVNWRQEGAPVADANAARIHRYRAALHESGVSEEQFRRSFAYYRAHPGELRALLDTLQRQPNLDTLAAPVGPRRKPAKPALPEVQ